MPVLLGEGRRHRQERIWAVVALALGLGGLAGLLVMRYGRPAEVPAAAAARRGDGKAEVAGRPRAGGDQAPAPATDGKAAAGPPAEPTAEPGRPAGGPDGRVTDLAAVLVDPEAAAGRPAELSSVLVRRVVSDRAFTVGDGSDQELLVLLDPRVEAKMADANVGLKPGMRLRLAGRFDRPPAPDVAQERYRGLSVQEAAAMRGQKTFLHAEAIGAVK